MTNIINWRKQHIAIIQSFLDYLNLKTHNYILKGGTALLLSYDLDRFSDDIDLDGMASDIETIISSFSMQNNFSFSIAKDTDTVKRFKINYEI